MAKPVVPGPHFAQAITDAVNLHRQGRLDEAEKLYNRVLKMQRDNFDALHLLGMLQHQRGKAGEALRLIAAALKINPRSADALANLAMVQHALKRSTEALASLDQALVLAPGHLDALNNRGNLLLDLQRPADALAAFEDVLAREPRHLPARINRGNALARLDRNAEAIADYDAALHLQPGHPIALYNRGNALRALGRDQEAVAAYEHALAAMPTHLNAWTNRGFALQALNRHDDAIASFGRALALKPDHADAHFGEATSRLTFGDYRAGWPKYEYRWTRSGMGARRSFRAPLWLGETPLAGKTILLHAEQGLGDTVQFVRYVPRIARAGAKVVLEVQPELKPLLSALDGAAAVLARGEPLPSFDLQCPLGSLPLACRTELATVPADIPYLAADPARIAKWRPRLDAVPAPRVALAWSGRASHVNDRNRSLAFERLAPLLALPGLSFVSVQRELRAGEAERIAVEPRLTHLGDALDDFADTAAVLSLVDLVISVDTAVAHVAAALDRPTFVLLPFQPDWRWLLGRDHTPWYPQVRLFRQGAPGDWDGTIARLADALASRAWVAP
jgi:tetratricopeptide (TPR) repeat protein